jgi:LmbE family N-acetylglucosaminyl deacetylase
MRNGSAPATIGGVSDLEGIERVLVVTAHPDDVDFGSAGTVAQWTAAGVRVSYCICTDGDAGGSDEAVSRSDMVGIRRAEQTAAARTVGVDDLHWLGYPDGRLTATIELRRDVSRVIRRVRPQRVLCQSPDRNWERIHASHPDHLAAGEAALCAVYPDARNPFAHQELKREEGLTEWTVPEVWVMGPFQTADRHVDITGTFDLKVAALRCHVSQVAHLDDLGDRLRTWAVATAAAAGLPDGRLAEAFRAVNTQ